MHALRRIAIASAATLVLGGLATPAFAADNGSVDAQVTVATPCILLTEPVSGTSDFGTLPFSTAGTTTEGQQPISYQNCGTAAQRIWAAGTDATGGDATWYLGAGPGPICDQPLNTYRIALFGLDGSPVGAILETTPVELQSLEPPFVTRLSATLSMPCVGSDGVGETMSFQILFTATF